MKMLFLPSKEYYTRISEFYDSIFADPVSQAEDAIVEGILERILAPGARILDCGCGTGLGRTMTSAITDDYLGIDISEAMIIRARQNHDRGSMFRVADMVRMDFLGDQTFDCVMSLNGAFSHVPDGRGAAAEMMRVLKPGGVLLVMVYSRYALSRLRRSWRNGFCQSEGLYAVRNAGEDCGSWARFYTPADLKRLLGTLENAKVIPLNIIPDNFFRRGDARRLTSIMAFEARLPRFVHGLAHALILTGTKPSQGHAPFKTPSSDRGNRKGQDPAHCPPENLC